MLELLKRENKLPEMVMGGLFFFFNSSSETESPVFLCCKSGASFLKLKLCWYNVNIKKSSMGPRESCIANGIHLQNMTLKSEFLE